MNADQLKVVLDLHAKWLNGEAGGIRAQLGMANLKNMDLQGANLRDANLAQADLTGARMMGADLSFANIRHTNFDKADLTNAILEHSRSSSAKLKNAILTGVQVANVKTDLFSILDAAPLEVAGLLLALKAGKIDGSTYSGPCCCLVGTIARLRGEQWDDLDGIEADPSRPAEIWFRRIDEGDTPGNSAIAKLTAEWIEEWITNHPAKEVQHDLR